jgi:hypothetical protein
LPPTTVKRPPPTFSRIRNDGIDPASRRNYYVGAALEF